MMSHKVNAAASAIMPKARIGLRSRMPTFRVGHPAPCGRVRRCKEDNSRPARNDFTLVEPQDLSCKCLAVAAPDRQLADRWLCPLRTSQ
jgi:hypothetical protein